MDNRFDELGALIDVVELAKALSLKAGSSIITADGKVEHPTSIKLADAALNAMTVTILREQEQK